MTRFLVVFLASASLTATARAADAPKAFVAPFTEISDGAKREWVGRAIHQSLVAELSRLAIVAPTSASGEVNVNDSEDAIKAAKVAGAQYAVHGSYQLLDQELRVTGQVLNVADGAVLGGIKATGNLRDLFGVEDIVAAQVKRALSSKLAPATQPTDALAERTTVEPTGPVRAAQQDGRRFDGSELEQSLDDNRPFAASSPVAFDDARERYRYSPQPYAPYGWTPYDYGYTPVYRYTPRYGYGYGGYSSHRYYGGDYCGPRVIVVPRRTTQVRVTVPVSPSRGRAVSPTRTVPNGNFNAGQGNTMQGGPGNTMRGGDGNTITGGSGNTNGRR